MTSLKDLALAIRFLSIDAVEEAQSGHPGMPLGMADIATVLWHSHLKHNPTNPCWFNRDRFVLSNGHGSMLLYALLHLTGYALTSDDLKKFRQLHSKTPGHPEWSHTPGVETTTGPLGQGLANAVGMAIAEKTLAAHFNQGELQLVDHYTYAFVGDGCLMEGISHEACSLAGTLGLGKLILFYDDNGISIDGKIEYWFTDNTAERFRAYHWHVVEDVDGHDPVAIEKAIQSAQQETTKPSLIMCKTIIGYGTGFAGSEKSHGAPLGAKEVQLKRERSHWSSPPFVIPEPLAQAWCHIEKGEEQEKAWLHCCHEYKTRFPERYEEFLRRINGDLPVRWQSASQQFIDQCQKNNTALATRKASQQCIEYYADILPELLGGSADLTSSNNTDWSGTKAINKEDFHGNYINYGVREFAMSAIMNGLALHGGFIPYGGTFLVFSDYARNAVRLSALMKQRVIFVYTHDSIGLGEDGPTHQPVEHAAMLRMTPNMCVWRPADTVETAVAWQQSIEHQHGPSSLLLSRQTLPSLPKSDASIENIKRGGYILWGEEEVPQAIVLATGSEVQLALGAAQEMEKRGITIRVVSMPCVERFLAQDKEYQVKVLPPSVRRRIAIEAAASAFWYQFVGLDGKVLGLDSFGVSAPGKEAFAYFGFTVEKVVSTLDDLLKQ